MPERRTWPRQALKPAVACQVEVTAHQWSAFGVLENLGPGGAGLYVAGTPPPGPWDASLYLLSGPATTRRRLSVRMASVRALPGGDSFLGVEFPRPLSAQDLTALLTGSP
jgi:hypothetical protein